MVFKHKRSIEIELSSEEKEIIKKYADFIGRIIRVTDTPLDFLDVWNGLEDPTFDFMSRGLNDCPNNIELDISYIKC